MNSIASTNEGLLFSRFSTTPPSWETINAWGYYAGWALMSRLPKHLTAQIFIWGADHASDNGAGMNQLRKNLSRVVGKENVTRALIRDSMRSYARYWYEAFRLPAMMKDRRVIEKIDRQVMGKQHLLEAVAKPTGTIVVATHSGNWDLAGMYVASQIGTFTTVAERLKPEKLFDTFVKFRQSLGFNVLAHTGAPGERSAYERLKDVVAAGGTVAIVGDRDLNGKGVEVEFCGETTTLPTGAARLALETGATLLVIDNWFTGTIFQPGWGMRFSPPIEVFSTDDVSDVVRRYSIIMADNIRKHPVDWHVLQPFWSADRTSNK
ncbi:Lauroyl/myristoyl acyltransferase [Corynebacterium mustelae]|uniref:Lauroyl/myristoyl acyltransferase n=1 Tax=Corynebacterium mustelae TaxID=571915 RepID=A0A0G3GY49_9CORY|nr:phosphatidylinositol mannoside acyltransferase [Corynebacterium mustelae]AKK06084.1 Lauroyl/myristoyl acyltransferase [Corynebacterium mustelae]